MADSIFKRLIRNIYYLQNFIWDQIVRADKNDNKKLDSDNKKTGPWKVNVQCASSVWDNHRLGGLNFNKGALNVHVIRLPEN